MNNQQDKIVGSKDDKNRTFTIILIILSILFIIINLYEIYIFLPNYKDIASQFGRHVPLPMKFDYYFMIMGILIEFIALIMGIILRNSQIKKLLIYALICIFLIIQIYFFYMYFNKYMIWPMPN